MAFAKSIYRHVKQVKKPIFTTMYCEYWEMILFKTEFRSFRFDTSFTAHEVVRMSDMYKKNPKI